MIKYLGSKRTLLPLITSVVDALGDVRTAIDLFSGTARVAHALKGAGLQVIANDHNAYAAVLARCYVEADAEEVTEPARRLIAELSALPGRAGYFTDTFCVRSRYFQPKNGERIDAIREAIAGKGLSPELEAVLLVSLMEAADRVDSTTGVQMAYLKTWAPRAHSDLALRMPAVLPRAAAGKGRALQGDALEVVGGLEADVLYLDPPYNQHKYLGNYHVWESLVLWDKPEVYGVAHKRVDVRTRRSAFNSRPAARAALQAVIDHARARHLVVSFSDEGYLSRDDVEAMLAAKRHVVVLARDFRRYVGAQIGIYNPSGEKVGAVSHLRNTEYLYVASDDPAALRRVTERVAASSPASSTGPSQVGEAPARGRPPSNAAQLGSRRRPAARRAVKAAPSALSSAPDDSSSLGASSALSGTGPAVGSFGSCGAVAPGETRSVTALRSAVEP